MKENPNRKTFAAINPLFCTNCSKSGEDLKVYDYPPPPSEACTQSVLLCLTSVLELENFTGRGSYCSQTLGLLNMYQDKIIGHRAHSMSRSVHLHHSSTAQPSNRHNYVDLKISQ